MKTLKLLAAAFLAFVLTSNLNAQEKTEIRNVKGFTGVNVSEGIKVELTFGDNEYVEVIAEEEDIQRVVTELEGSTLDIHIKGNNWNSWNKKILVKVTAVKIEFLDASSGSRIETQNLVISDNLKLGVSSGADLKVAFNANSASCDANSGSSATLKGESQLFKAQASSGSSIHANELKAMKVKADVSSGASISVNANEEIEAEASSGGSIKYSGSPKMKDIEKSSGGSVHGN
jgi:hypothetical protein